MCPNGESLIGSRPIRISGRREQVWPEVVQNLSFRVGVPVFRHEDT